MGKIHIIFLLVYGNDPIFRIVYSNPSAGSSMSWLVANMLVNSFIFIPILQNSIRIESKGMETETWTGFKYHHP